MTVYFCYLCVCRNYLLNWTKIRLAFRIPLIFSACPAHVVVVVVVVVVVAVVVVVVVVVVIGRDEARA